jgi:hypothetical protein
MGPSHHSFTLSTAPAAIIQMALVAILPDGPSVTTGVVVGQQQFALVQGTQPHVAQTLTLSSPLRVERQQVIGIQNLSTGDVNLVMNPGTGKLLQLFSFFPCELTISSVTTVFRPTSGRARSVGDSFTFKASKLECTGHASFKRWRHWVLTLPGSRVSSPSYLTVWSKLFRSLHLAVVILRM